MKKETKLGLLALVTIAVIVVGYNFLKGQELFSSTNTYYVIYENVEQLGVGDAVTRSGKKIGQVTSIEFIAENVNALLVGLTVEEQANLRLPKDTEALIKSEGPLGGKYIALKYTRPCRDADCAVDGDYLVAGSEGLIESLIGDPAQLREYAEVARDAVGPVVDSIAGRLDTNGVGRTLRNTEIATANLAALTAKLDRLLARTSGDLAETTQSVAAITDNLERNNARIGSILANVDSTTRSLAQVDLAASLRQVDATLQQLQGTLKSSDGAIENLNAVTAKVARGEGSLGKLLTEDSLHTDMERTLTSLDLLLQDFRLNPKRYVNVSVFGKKDKEYKVPEDDPAQNLYPE